MVYKLTDFGRSLIPVICVIGLWGDEHKSHLKTVFG
ncbi:winged helix-turn-helix transcriptional regulator [Mucilaginibacter terrigena]|nr:winged helix-turn-helix transcriptional regulator [Mucilaginibacter terrigena]